jgi:cytochrome c-type biogenesis protein CcmE
VIAALSVFHKLRLSDYQKTGCKMPRKNNTRLQDRVGVRFQLEDKNLTDKFLWVTYTGATPAAFAPGAEVIVEGVYMGAQRSVEARKLMTQCPSKYTRNDI